MQGKFKLRIMETTLLALGFLTKENVKYSIMHPLAFMATASVLMAAAWSNWASITLAIVLVLCECGLLLLYSGHLDVYNWFRCKIEAEFKKRYELIDVFASGRSKEYSLYKEINIPLQGNVNADNSEAVAVQAMKEFFPNATKCDFSSRRFIMSNTDDDAQIFFAIMHIKTPFLCVRT